MEKRSYVSCVLWCYTSHIWNNSETKESVEKNEVHLHEQWLRKTQAAVNPVVLSAAYEDEDDQAEQLTRPHSVFETNLSVWR